MYWYGFLTGFLIVQAFVVLWLIAQNELRRDQTKRIMLLLKIWSEVENDETIQKNQKI